MIRLLSTSSSNADVCVPNARENVAPDISAGSAGSSKPYLTLRYGPSAGTSGSSNAYFRLTHLPSQDLMP